MQLRFLVSQCQTAGNQCSRKCQIAANQWWLEYGLRTQSRSESGYGFEYGWESCKKFRSDPDTASDPDPGWDRNAQRPNLSAVMIVTRIASTTDKQ